MPFVLLVEPDHHCGLSPFPWGTLAVGSYLRACGIPSALVNASYAEREDFEAELRELLPKATLLGVSCFSTDAAWVLDLLAKVREERPDLPVVLGGPHPTLLPEQTAAHPLVDYAVKGPGERAMEALALLTEAGERPTDEQLSNLPGLFWRDGQGTVRQGPEAGVPPAYAIDYGMLPPRKLADLPRYMEVLAGRGCSFACAFCYNAVCGHKWAGKEAEALADEVGAVVASFDPDVIYFRDENFFHSKERLLRFLELYRERGFRFKWDATCRANYFSKGYVTPELLERLSAHGCRRLKFGMESGSPQVLKLLRKGVRVEQIEHVAQTLAASPIIGNYSFLMGVPGEKRQDYLATMGLISRILDADPKAEIIGPQYYRVYPGGELYDEVVNRWGFRQPQSLDAWADSVRDDFFGLHKALDYAWIDGGADLPRHADFLVLLARKPLRGLLHPLKLPALPFALLARLRLKLGWYGALWDIKLAAWMFRRYVESVYLPRCKAGQVG